MTLTKLWMAVMQTSSLQSSGSGGRGGASRRLQNIEVADLVCPHPKCGVSAGEDWGAAD